MKKKRADLISKILNQRSQPEGVHNGHIDEAIVMRDVRELVPNKKNEFYSTDNIDELAAMLNITHNMEPIILKAGTLVITSGHRRRLAKLYMLEHGMTDDPMVPTIEREIVNEFAEAGITDDEMETLNIIFPNKGTRRILTPNEETAEIALIKPAIKKIYDYLKERGEINGKFRTFFADLLGISPTALQRKESLSNLAEDVKQDVDAGTITATAAAELASLDDEDQKEVVRRLKDQGEEVTVKAVKAEKERLHQATDEPAENVHQPVAEPEPESAIESDPLPHDEPEEDIRVDTGENEDNDADDEVISEPEDDQEQEESQEPEQIAPFQEEAETDVVEAEKLLYEEAQKEEEADHGEEIISHIKAVMAYCSSHDVNGSPQCDRCRLRQNGWCFVGGGVRPAEWNF